MKRGHSNVLDALKKQKLVVILRGIPEDRLDGVVTALIEAGVGILEFTFDHFEDNYLITNKNKIKYTVEHYGDRIIVGCGTALSVEEVEAAYEAGAELVISPDVNPEIIKKTKELGMVSMPGALTPTEIVSAYRCGADIVKLFPAGDFGPGYIKAVRGPLAHISMSAVGGIKPENIPEFLDAGVCGFGVGSQMVSPAAVKAEDYAEIRARASEFTDAITAWEKKQCF